MSTDRVDEAELVARARGGDAAAFGELVDRHRRAVYRAARAVLRSHADAEDAAQDAFVAAFRHLDRFRGGSTFRTWLLTIAWRQALNRRRGAAGVWHRLLGRGVADDREDPLADIAADGRTPEQAAVDRQLRRDVRAAIDRLKPPLRDALLLAQSGEYSYEEIGAMVGAPVGTIKWRVSEARRSVRQQLRAKGYLDV